MNFSVIACTVFRHEIEQLAAECPHTLAIDYLELGEHAHPHTLRANLQSKIDAIHAADAILLAYGLCGCATEGLAARKIPLVLPRSHDCAGILLGSRKRFEAIFKDMPSTPFSSVGFIENGDYFFNDGERMLGDSWAHLVEQYGDEDARYIWDAMHPRLDGQLQPVYFIRMPGVQDDNARAQCREHADNEGRDYRELDGDLRLLRKLLHGEHDEEEFLTLHPGETLRQTADWDRIITTHPPPPQP